MGSNAAGAPNWVRRGGLLIFAALLVTYGVLVSVYVRAQTDLILEGNDLYTPNAMTVQGDFAEVAEKLRAHGVEFHALRELDGEYRTRALFHSGSHSFQIPAHNTIGNLPADVCTAVIGSDVRGDSPDVNRITVSGIPCVVAGSLGRSSNSLLSHQIVLSGAELFVGYTGPFVIDGVSLNPEFLRGLGITALPVAHGTSHRTNIDFITPALIALCAVLTCLCSIAVGVLGALCVRDRNSILRTVGCSVRRIRLFTLSEALIPVLALSIITRALASHSASSLSVPALDRVLLVVVCGTAAGVGLCEVLARRRASE